MWKVLGKNDEVTVCECCGKANLKLTVILTNGEGEVRYGRDCAARVLAPICRGGKVVGSYLTATKIERMAERAELDREKAERRKTMLATPNF
jgi:hypothetical protein